MRVARERGADYAFLLTSEDDQLARRHEAAGFRRTEGEGGPLMLAYERELYSVHWRGDGWWGRTDREDPSVVRSR